MITTGELQRRTERTRQRFETAVREGNEEGVDASTARIELLLNLLDESRVNDNKLRDTLTEMQDKARKGEEPRVIPRIDAYLAVLETWRDYSLE